MQETEAKVQKRSQHHSTPGSRRNTEAWKRIWRTGKESRKGKELKKKNRHPTHHSSLSQSRVRATRMPCCDEVRVRHISKHQRPVASLLLSAELRGLEKNGDCKRADNECRLHLLPLYGIAETSEEMTLIKEREPVDRTPKSRHNGLDYLQTRAERLNKREGSTHSEYKSSIIANSL